MQRVIVAGLVGLLALAGLTACQPPPANYRPPVIDSVTLLTPQPAAPGEDVTFEIAVHDDEIISHAVARELVVPGGSLLPGPRTCTASVLQVGSLKEAVITVTCPVPTFASNGTWSTEVFIGDRPPHTSIEIRYPGTERRLSFQVAGGSEDRSGPGLVSYQTDPAVIGQETSFTLSMRVHDATPPVDVRYEQVSFGKAFSNSRLSCGNPVYTPVSATDTDIVLTCNPGYTSSSTAGRAEMGLHVARPELRDALGQSRQVELQLDVQYEAPSPTP